MSVQAMSWALDQQMVSGHGPRHVLLVLANYAGEDGRAAFPSVATISRQTGLSRRAVQSNIALLVEAGAITPGNPLIAAAWIGRHDQRPNVWDIAMQQRPVASGDIPRGAESAPRGVNGVQITTERGAAAAPEPSITFIDMGVAPAWLTEELWKRWASYRYKRDRKGWTPEAAQLGLRTLTLLVREGHDPTRVIEQSIEHGWTGLFPVKPTEGAKHAGHHRSSTGRTSAAERVADACRRLDTLERASQADT